MTYITYINLLKEMTCSAWSDCNIIGKVIVVPFIFISILLGLIIILLFVDIPAFSIRLINWLFFKKTIKNTGF